MRHFRTHLWIFTGLALCALSGTALAQYGGPRRGFDLPTDPMDQIVEGQFSVKYFMIERPALDPQQLHVRVMAGFDGFLAARGRNGGLYLTAVKTDELTAIPFGLDQRLELALFGPEMRRLTLSRVEASDQDIYLWADIDGKRGPRHSGGDGHGRGRRNRPERVLKAHLAMGATLTQATGASPQQLHEMGRRIDDPLYTYLYNLLGPSRDWPALTSQSIPEPKPKPAPKPHPQPKPLPATQAEVASLLMELERSAFSDDKVNTLTLWLQSHYLTVDGAHRILARFAFSGDKIRAMELIAGKLTDLENGYLLLKVFPFSADKTRVKEILEQAKRDAAATVPPPAPVPPAPAPPAPQPHVPDPNKALAQLMDTLNSAQGLDAKLGAISAFLRYFRISPAVAVRMLETFRNAEHRLSALERIAPRLTDYENTGAIVGCFRFRVDRGEASRILQEAKRNDSRHR